MDQKYPGEFVIESVNQTLFTITAAVEQNLYRGINDLLASDKDFYAKCHIEIQD